MTPKLLKISNFGVISPLYPNFVYHSLSLNFSTGFHWRIFLLSRANRLCSIFFYTGLKNLGSLMSQIFFCLQPGILALICLPATNPAKQLAFLLFTSAKGRGSPLPFWGPSQSFSFSLLPLGVRRPEFTKYQHLLIPLCDLHSSLNGHFF